MIYQSMSGDASEGTGTFTSENSTLSISKDSKYYESAPMFFVTNTDVVINLTLDKNSTVKLTSDTYLTSLNDDDSTYSNIDFNGYTLYVNSKAIN